MIRSTNVEGFAYTPRTLDLTVYYSSRPSNTGVSSYTLTYTLKVAACCERRSPASCQEDNHLLWPHQRHCGSLPKRREGLGC